MCCYSFWSALASQYACRNNKPSVRDLIFATTWKYQATVKKRKKEIQLQNIFELQDVRDKGLADTSESICKLVIQSFHFCLEPCKSSSVCVGVRAGRKWLRLCRKEEKQRMEKRWWNSLMWLQKKKKNLYFNVVFSLTVLYLSLSFVKNLFLFTDSLLKNCCFFIILNWLILLLFSFC